MDFASGRTPYDILEIKNGPEATEAEIRKAYKLLALKKHPDKNKNNPNAAAEFAELEKAYRVLTDANARGALDDYLSAKAHRAQRQSQETDKRRKMREELEKREREVAVQRDEESLARNRLAQELERLRKKLEDEAAQAAQAAAAAAATHVDAAGVQGMPASMPSETQEQLKCTLKVSWDPSTRDYTPTELRTIFSAHGTVADLVVRDKKAKSSHRAHRTKASALVVMSSASEASKAANAVNGDVSDPLLVLPLLKVAPDSGKISSVYENTQPIPQPSSPRVDDPRNVAVLFPSSTPSSSDTKPKEPAKPMFPVSNGSGSTLASQPASPLFPAATPTKFPGFPSSQGPGVRSNSSTPSTSGFSFNAGGLGPGFFNQINSAENAVLEKMRRAAEREKQLQQAKTEADNGS